MASGCARAALVTLAWLSIALLLMAARPAPNLGRDKVSASLAAKAAAAYAEGDFPRSAQLYLEAYSAKPDALFLYGAARAEQLAGELEAAEQHYRKFVETGAAVDPARVETARQKLAEIRGARAEARAREAEAAEKASWKSLIGYAPTGIERTAGARGAVPTGAAAERLGVSGDMLRWYLAHGIVTFSGAKIGRMRLCRVSLRTRRSKHIGTRWS